MLGGSSSAQWRSTAQTRVQLCRHRRPAAPLHLSARFRTSMGGSESKLNSLEAPTGHKVLIAAPADEYLSLRSWYYFFFFFFGFFLFLLSPNCASSDSDVSAAPFRQPHPSALGCSLMRPSWEPCLPAARRGAKSAAGKP